MVVRLGIDDILLIDLVIDSDACTGETARHPISSILLASGQILFLLLIVAM